MTKTMQLTKGYVTIVDDDDFDQLSQYRWKACKSKRSKVYAGRMMWLGGGKRKHILMHRLITNCPPHLQIDHINGDTLDNRKVNLRFATAQQNRWNTPGKAGSSSQYCGVVWNAACQKWQAHIRRGRKLHYLGLFTDEAEAARAYDRAARECSDHFAYLNFPSQGSI